MDIFKNKRPALLMSAGSLLAPTMVAAQDITFRHDLTPPSSFTTLAQLADAVSGWILRISIPLAVIMIIYAGIRFLLARGNPGEVTKAKEILKYVLIGLAIIFIGAGFISLITSIVALPKIT